MIVLAHRDGYTQREIAAPFGTPTWHNQISDQGRPDPIEERNAGDALSLS
ncbi:hypothetical protein [Enteractinococcus helveticum]